MDEGRFQLSEQDRLRHEALSGNIDYIQNVRKPEGEDGRTMTRRMNGGEHALLAGWGFSQLHDIPVDASVLDAGCGGGANLARWMEFCPRGKVYGLDYSQISVEESLAVNADAVAQGRCAVDCGDVAAMPYGDASFDVVSAFETIYFWPDMPRALKEVFRVLRKGGTFFICNESDGTDSRSIEAAKIIRGLILYTADSLRQMLSEAGFTDMEFHTHGEKPWLAVIAIRK